MSSARDTGAGLRIAVSTDDLGDQEVLGLIVQGEFALLHERLNARRPEPLRDGTAAIEFTQVDDRRARRAGVAQPAQW